jgi:type II secretory pathway pseudopilin PulG
MNSLRQYHSHLHLHRRHAGFTYIGLLIFIALIGIASSASMQVGSLSQRRGAEEALLDIGGEFQQALLSYANATPQGQQRFPHALEDLLKDPRYPNTVRHLRRLYIDPLTGNNAWGIIATPDAKGIAGVFSLSEARPIKIGNFDGAFRDFDGKTSYQGWRFVNPSHVVSPAAAGYNLRDQLIEQEKHR